MKYEVALSMLAVFGCALAANIDSTSQSPTPQGPAASSSKVAGKALPEPQEVQAPVYILYPVFTDETSNSTGGKKQQPLYALNVIEDKTDAPEEGTSNTNTLLSSSAVNTPELQAGFMCIAHGKVFNGRNTCKVACMAGCMQPGCGGYSNCEQIPNVRLHKYKCHCN